MRGDCLQRLKELQANSVHMVLADMPYGTTACKWDSVINLDKLWEQLLRVTKPNAAIVLTAQTPFDKVLGCSNLRMLKYEWVWEKTNATGHLNAKKCPMKAHENILVFYDRLPTYNPQKTSGHKPVNSFSKKHDSAGACYGKTATSKGGGNTDRYPRSVQLFASDKQKSKLHPTQKPLALMRYMVRTYTNEGDTVLDFCMGSGTTGVACAEERRNFIGIEKDETFYGMARDRIRQSKQ